MLKAIELENFKAFGERSRIEFAPITLIFGENSAGKSSVLQSLNLLKQSRESRDTGTLILPRTDGGIVDLGGFKELVFDHDLSRSVTIRVDLLDSGRGQYHRSVGDDGHRERSTGIEVAFKRPTEEDDVQLDSLSLHSSDIPEQVASFTPLELEHAQRKKLIRDLTPFRNYRPESMADVGAAKCDSLTSEPSFWQDVFERTKRRSDKIADELRQLQSEGLEDK